MGTSVFGTPITDETLKSMEAWKDKPIARYQLAIAAFEMKNTEGKDEKAREFAESRRRTNGFDTVMCLIYNATGDVVTLDTYCDVDGTIAPSPHPMVIGNGQWGVFLKRGGGAVVYRARDPNGYEKQIAYMYRAVEPGRCYTEIREKNYYKLKDPWQTYQTQLDAHSSYIYQVHEQGFSSFASIGGTTRSPVFEALMTLQGAYSRYPPARYTPYSFKTMDRSDLVVTPDAEDTATEPKEGEELTSMVYEQGAPLNSLA